MTENLAVLEGRTSSSIVAENLNAMHAAQKTFVESEAAEKVRRALRSKVRSSGDTKYFTGDIVYYKRNNWSHWKRPDTVTGQGRQQAPVYHGNPHHAHPCKLQLKDTYKNQLEEKISLSDNDNSEKHKSNFQELEITRNDEDESNRNMEEEIQPSLSNTGDQCVGKHSEFMGLTGSVKLKVKGMACS